MKVRQHRWPAYLFMVTTPFWRCQAGPSCIHPDCYLCLLTNADEGKDITKMGQRLVFEPGKGWQMETMTSDGATIQDSDAWLIKTDATGNL
jgi:hypothetical protein